MDKILIYGYGNPGRKDDGLGIRFAEEMEKWANENALENIYFDTNYQLNPEDAVEVSAYNIVLFVDASMEDIHNFAILKVEADDKTDFSLHSISPGYVSHLCKTIYGKLPSVYLLHLKGYQWQLEDGISFEAFANLKQALAYVQSALDQHFANLETNSMRIFDFNKYDYENFNFIYGPSA